MVNVKPTTSDTAQEGREASKQTRPWDNEVVKSFLVETANGGIPRNHTSRKESEVNHCL